MDEFDFSEFDILVDALFGIGLDRPPEGAALDCIRRMNEAEAIRIAVDIPSGVEADGGNFDNVELIPEYIDDEVAALKPDSHWLRYTGTAVFDGDPKYAEAALAEKQVDLKYTKILAPFDGYSGFKQYSVGNMVGPSSGVLARIAAAGDAKVYFSIDELDLDQISPPIRPVMKRFLEMYSDQ